MRTVKGVLIDVHQAMCRTIAIEDRLEEYYKILHCDYIDISRRRIGSGYYDVVCDDEGLLKKSPIPSAYDQNGGIAFVGNIFVCQSNDVGDLVSLTEDEIRTLRANVRVGVHFEPNGDKELRVVLFNVNPA